MVVKIRFIQNRTDFTQYANEITLVDILEDSVFDCTKYMKYRLSDKILVVKIEPKISSNDSVYSLIESMYNDEFYDHYLICVNVYDKRRRFRSYSLEESLNDLRIKEKATNEVVEAIDNYYRVIAGYMLQWLTERDYKKNIAIYTSIYGSKTLNKDCINLIEEYSPYTADDLDNRKKLIWR